MKAKKRIIRPGNEFNTLLPYHKEHQEVMLKNPRIEDTMGLVVRTIKSTFYDTKELATRLKGPTILESCRNIYQFIIDYVQYEYDFRDGDIEAIERVKAPCGLWRDRGVGGDCEDYSIFISTILIHLKIPHSLRITKYGNNPSWQHIYVVAYDGSDKYITIDPVVDYAFNKEVPYRAKKDYPIIAVKGSTTVSTVDAVIPDRGQSVVKSSTQSESKRAVLAGIQSRITSMKQTVDSLAFSQAATLLSGLGSDDAALREAFMSYVSRYNYKSAGTLSDKVQRVRNWLKTEPNNPSVLQKYVAIMNSQGAGASNAAINADIDRLGIFGPSNAFVAPAPAPSVPPQTTTFDNSAPRQTQVFQDAIGPPNPSYIAGGSNSGSPAVPMPGNLPATTTQTAGAGAGFQQYLTKKNMLIAAGVVGLGIVATKML